MAQHYLIESPTTAVLIADFLTIPGSSLIEVQEPVDGLLGLVEVTFDGKPALMFVQHIIQHGRRITAESALSDMPEPVAVRIFESRMKMSKSPTPPTNRQELEESWRLKVAEAEERYRLANKEYRRMLKEEAEGVPPSPDLQQARELESAALAEYTRISRIVMDMRSQTDKLGAQIVKNPGGANV